MNLFIGLDENFLFECKLQDYDSKKFGCWFLFENIVSKEIKFEDLKDFKNLLKYSNISIFKDFYKHSEQLMLEMIWYFFNFIVKGNLDIKFKVLKFNFENIISKNYDPMKIYEYFSFDDIKQKKFENDFNFEPKIKIQELFLESCFDVSFLIIGMSFFKCKQQPIMFNLPAGSGKTFNMNILLKLFDLKNLSYLLSCPTWMACLLYDSKNVNTIHSNFLINPHTKKMKLNKIKTKHYFFDEHSMISEDIYSLIESSMSGYVFALGDSAQLKPVSGLELIKDRFCLFEASPDFILPRFDINYAKFVKDIRGKILFENYKFDKENFLKTLNSISIEEFSADIFNEDYTKTIDCINSKNYDAIPQLKYTICGKNKTALEIKKKFNFNLSQEFKYSFFINEKFDIDILKKNTKIISNFFDKLPPNLGLDNIHVGTNVIFKKNSKDVGVCNGKLDTLIGISFENFEIVDIIPVAHKENIKNLVVYRGSLPILKFKDYKYKGLTEEITIEDIKYEINVYFIQSAYALTLHSLQGSTISSIHKTFVNDDTLLFNPWIAAYVLISRFPNAKSLCITKKLYNTIQDLFINEVLVL